MFLHNYTPILFTLADICTVCAEKWMEAAFKKQFEYQDAPIYIIKREKGEASVYSEDEEEPVKESVSILNAFHLLSSS